MVHIGWVEFKKKIGNSNILFIYLFISIYLFINHIFAKSSWGFWEFFPPNIATGVAWESVKDWKLRGIVCLIYDIQRIGNAWGTHKVEFLSYPWASSIKCSNTAPFLFLGLIEERQRYSPFSFPGPHHRMQRCSPFSFPGLDNKCEVKFRSPEYQAGPKRHKLFLTCIQLGIGPSSFPNPP